MEQNHIERWELFRQEMQTHQDRLKKLAISFIELDAFDDAAKCSIQAAGIKYVLARMPPSMDGADRVIARLETGGEKL